MGTTFRLGGLGPFTEMREGLRSSKGERRLGMAHRMMQGFVNHVRNFALCYLVSREALGGCLKHLINIGFEVGKQS